MEKQETFIKIFSVQEGKETKLDDMINTYAKENNLDIVSLSLDTASKIISTFGSKDVVQYWYSALVLFKRNTQS